MRELPLRVPPLDGESFYGYIVRLSATYGVPPGDIKIAVGFWDGEERFDRRSAPFSLSSDQLENMAFATGLSQERIKAMTLEHLDGKVFNADRSIEYAKGIPAGIGKRATVWDTAYCPHCLADTGTWFLDWHSRWTLICQEHECALLETCPDCGMAPSDLRRLRWPKVNGEEETDLTKCRWAIRGKLCRCDLRLAQTDLVDQRTVKAHGRLSAMLSGSLEAKMGGCTIDSVALVSDLIGLMHVCRLTDEEHSPRLVAERFAKAPAGVPEIAASRSEKLRLLPRAMELVDISDPSELAETLREIGNRAHENARLRLPPATQFPGCSAPFADAIRKATDKCSWAKPSRIHGYDNRRHSRPTDLDPRLEPRHVPQLFWDRDFEEEIFPLFEDTLIRVRRARLLCSAILIRMLVPATWGEAAIALGFKGARPRNPALEVNMSNLRATGRDGEVIAKIKEIANRKAGHDELTDFRTLAASLKKWHGIDPLTFRFLHEGRLPRKLWGPHDLRREYLSSRVWAQVTQSNETDSTFWGGKQLHLYQRFLRTYFRRVEERVSEFELILASNSNSSQSFIRGILIGDLVARGELSPQAYSEPLDSELIDRVLAHVSHHTGVDIPSIQISGFARALPVAVLRARRLVAMILRRLSGTAWIEILPVLGSKSQMSYMRRDYQAWLDGNAVDEDLDLLIARVRDGSRSVPSPAGPEPHVERMFRLGQTIRQETFRITGGNGKLSPIDQTSLSLAGCRLHTDLKWPALNHIHGIGAQIKTHSFNPYRWHEMSSEASRYVRQVVDRALELRREAGYGNAQVEDLSGVGSKDRGHKIPGLDASQAG